MEPMRKRGTVCRAKIRRVIRGAQGYRRAAVIVSTVTLAACASAPIRTDDPGTAATPAEVFVRNDASADVTVFAYRGDLRVRIGEVTSHSTGFVTVPVGMLNYGHVQLMLHKLGGGDFIADEVAIRPAEEHAELHVLDVLDESALTVAPGRMH